MTESERKKAWYAANRDRLRAKERERYLANCEEIKAKSRAWHEANKEHANKRRRAYDLARPEEVKAKRAEYYQRNREKILETERQRKARNPEKNRARVRRWREEVSPEKWEAHCARRQEREVERREENPEKYLLQRATSTLRLTTGIPASELSREVVEAKAAQLAVFEAIRKLGMCRRGHPLTEENYRLRASKGAHECLACQRERNSARKHKTEVPA